MQQFERIYGSFLGLALGDAISYPAALHRGLRLDTWQRAFQRRTDMEMLEHRILRLTLPFGFGYGDDALLLGPTDDTEMAAFSAQILIQHRATPRTDDFLRAWQERVLARADDVWTGISEHAAIENLRRGLRPPTTGNDNPQFYDDSVVARTVPAGLAWAGDPDRAAEMAAIDARITHADDGVWAAQAMAAAVSTAAGGGTLDEALAVGRARFPSGSWIAWVDRAVADLARTQAHPAGLALTLSQAIIKRSYANAAPETLPAVFALVQATRGDVWQGVLLANTRARVSDSLPALVGALQGIAAIPAVWEEDLCTLRGVCLPDLAGVDPREMATGLAALP